MLGRSSMHCHRQGRLPQWHSRFHKSSAALHKNDMESKLSVTRSRSSSAEQYNRLNANMVSSGFKYDVRMP